jgi:hypothetical protein
MAHGDVGAVIDTLEFDATNAADCWGINVNDNVYVVAYAGPPAGVTNLYITTFSIDAAGEISNTVLATLALSTSWGVLPHIIKVSPNVFAIVYQGTNYHLTVETVSISDDGLTLASIEELIIVAADCRAPKIIRVAGDVFAVSYSQTGITTVKVSTITIDSAGDVSAIIDTIDLTATGQYYSNILAVNSTIFAISYLDTVNGVTVATIEIDVAGEITNTVEDSQVIDAQGDNYRFGMTEALTGVFAIAHPGTDLDGFVSTVTISPAGVISAVVDTLEIHTANVTQLHIIHIGQGICAITFKKDVPLDGCIATIGIDADGDNIAIIDAGLDFETTLFSDGMLLPISGDIYAVFYGGVGVDGFVKSLDISTAPPGGPHHEMMLGMGP